MSTIVPHGGDPHRTAVPAEVVLGAPGAAGAAAAVGQDGREAGPR